MRKNELREDSMRKIHILLSILCVSFVLGQYDYSLEDINSSSEYYEQNVGPFSFPDQVTMHYFGHYN